MQPWKWVTGLLLLISFSYSLHAQPYDYPTANLSTLWINDPSIITHNVSFLDGSSVRSILLRGSLGPRFACGFFCNRTNGACDSFLFAIFIVQTNSVSYITSPAIGFPQVVWSANRNNPVRENATLELTQEGDLVLRDVDGAMVWSTNTSGKSVVGMNISETGNLVLFNRNNSIVWQSFDYPTDSLVLGQNLMEGQRLTASVSVLNSTQSLLSLSVIANGLSAFVASDPPQIYYKRTSSRTKNSTEPSYMRFMNGSFAFFTSSSEPSLQDFDFTVPLASSVQYMKLESDGHLRVYEWGAGWKVVADLITGSILGVCGYPTICGDYGICSNGQCSCPRGIAGDYFTQLNARQPNLGCSAITPLSCQTPQYHHLLDLADISYFNYADDDAAVLKGTDAESCRDACMKNCSCKAALFQYGGNSSYGDCFLPSRLFSLINNQQEVTHYNSSAFIKVQIPPIAPSPNPSNGANAPLSFGKKKIRTAVILGSSLAAVFGAFLLICICIMVLRRKNGEREEEEEEDFFDQVPGMPMRFSYENLKAATGNFFNKLGEGGFGSVFEGTLDDGTRVAVKRLDGIGQGKREFLAEVETIGSIHHVNMARLIGFCAEKSYRLLVYEYMCNGSLDKWIFFRKYQKPALDWQTKRKIIIDVAKGLAYLHEECRQRIAHLDIKPHNILLDENFNAKISDFGLSKLIDRDQSHVITRMRGTPGYLAPEWLSSKITEKVDVYSFGVVVLEIVCGRKNFDESQSEESIHLLSLLKSKAEEDRLLDVIDKQDKDMQSHGEETMKMIKLAVWCLQGDFTRRPSMSMVVKVLEGVMDVEPGLDYNFLTSTRTAAHKEVDLGVSAPPLASVLSGPR
ncbi:G-type lectin S-receptor-like serine/threonine-protein kinase SD2-5 [Magnolia sinica]|uniref:G-type lectin S-receptor-like serine/threonine-protein kinase SD2-5 n=1 Tax=Magnolia sinica TaxID=86752 RepID=UPI002658A18E|nr:G-type lectin S-receptor-like serine/threonine-protein kinase SD2-5 [Magnolia sinica]